MPWIATGFLIAVIAAAALSLRMGWRHPSFHMALMLLAFWIIGNLTDPFIDPVMDAAGTYAALAAWWSRGHLRNKRRHDRWAIVLTVAFMAQLSVHPVFDPQSALRMAILNVLLAIEILAVSLPGGLSALQDCRRAFVRRRPACGVDRGEVPARMRGANQPDEDGKLTGASVE